MFAAASAGTKHNNAPSRFGYGETAVEVSLPMAVRPSLPRLLRLGDRAQFFAVVDNIDGPPAGTVTVQATSGDARHLSIDSPKKVTTTIDKHGQARVPFTVIAGQLGSHSLRLTATLSSKTGGATLKDTVVRKLVVEPETVREMSMEGTVDSDVAGALAIDIPGDALQGYGELSVSFASADFKFRGLAGAFDYLVHYPNGCIEQTSSSLLPLLALALHENDPTDRRLDAMREQLLTGLETIQKDAGAPSHQSLFDSPVRTRAIVLFALLHIAPNHPSLSGLVERLLRQRENGHWGNTQENAYALLAVSKYAEQQKRTTASDFEVQTWINDTPLPMWKFNGSGDPFSDVFTVPLDKLRSSKGPRQRARLVIHRKGQGLLHYQASLSWAPSTRLQKRHRGLRIERSLRASKPEIARGGSLRVGDYVAMDIKVHSEQNLSYVAVDAPIPAGLEYVHHDFERKSAKKALGGDDGDWVSSETGRRDRITLFADQLKQGESRLTVYLKATASGTFAAPSASAEAMYFPAITGRTAPDTISIEPHLADAVGGPAQ